MKSLKENVLVNIGFIIVLCALGFVAMLTFRDLRVYRTESGWVNHTYRAIEINTQLLSNIKDAETGTRGFILSGDSNLLVPFINSYPRHRKLLDQLKMLSSDDEKQQERIDTLVELCEHRFELLNNWISKRATEGFSAAQTVFPMYKGKETMDHIRHLSMQIDAEERRLLEERQQNVINSFNSTQQVFVWTMVLSVIALCILFYFLKRQITRRRKMQHEAQEKVQTESLLAEIKSRQKTEVENQKLITSLMQHINNLQQFTYIVSHNLRSPVAKILGLSELFPTADENAKSFIINAMTKEAAYLDTVIKDLNTIVNIRNNQTENQEILNIKHECLIILDTLQQEIRKSNALINLHCTENKSVYAIKSYLVSILSNIIGNAIKYRDPARQLVININCSEQKNYDVIRIEDNGLGIDLTKNKDKIFGLYKRFHNHIEGRGIGLHISQTQMKMMEGKIEVESEPGHGTTFILYFLKKSVTVHE